MPRACAELFVTETPRRRPGTYPLPHQHVARRRYVYMAESVVSVAPCAEFFVTETPKGKVTDPRKLALIKKVCEITCMLASD